ncbi:MAG: NfeD family protein [bacterium]|nr:NfeD family protein [bacterium]
MTEAISSIPLELIWAILGIIFIFCEFIIPGLVIAFFGVGALITALTTWLSITPELSHQLVMFIISSLLLLGFLRRYLKPIFMGAATRVGEKTNFDVEIGKIVPVTEYIQPGEVGGKVRYQGTGWSATASEPIAPGESVRIIGADNLTLLVEKVEK